MRFNTFTLILSFILLCTCLFQSGCEEQTTRYERLDPEWFNQPIWEEIRSSSAQYDTAPEPQRNRVRNNQAPRIKFDRNKMSHDFGKISSGSSNNVCEFAFSNVGNDNLIISSLKSSCDCIKVILEGDKREYAPGESGKIITQYEDTELGQAIKHIYLGSNDPANPRAELAVKADIVAPVDFEPKRITLSMIGKNGDCPEIRVKSLDNKPFAITGFVSNGNCITAEFNPNQKATEFVLKPKVDMAQLAGAPEGAFRINLSHPDCKVVSGSFYTPPRFSISPRRIIVNNANPSRTVVKTINITSNYSEDFDVQPSSSRRGVVNILNTQKTRNGYQVTVGINPPASKKGDKMFSENINLSLPGIDTFTVQCNGYYPGTVIKQSEEDEECKTCGPVRLDKPSMSLRPR